MELRQLKYFIGIVDAGSLTRAAQHLHIAQPALGAQIANLESELGVQLLVRSVRGVTPTEAGHTFYKHAQMILRTCEQAKLATQATGSGVSGTVSVGLPSSVIGPVGLSLLSHLKGAYPNVRLQLTDSPSAHLGELLLQGRLDMAILFGSEPVKGLVQARLFTDHLLFITSPEIARGLPADVRLAEVARHPLVLPTPPNATRLQVDAAFAALSLAPDLYAEINSMSMLAQVVSSGRASTINSWSSVARELGDGVLAGHPIVEPQLTRTLSLCHPDVAPLSGAAEAVFTMLQRLMMDLVRDGTWRGALA